MGNSTLITDYLGYGPAAGRPAAPAVPAGCLGLYYAADIGQVYVWDGAWQAWAPPGQSFAGSLAGAGTSQGTAAALAADVNLFTTVAAGSGAVLSAGAAGTWQKVLNRGAASLLVYPPPGGAIDAGAADAPATILAGGGATFWQNSATQWYSE
ncbi:conserved hypothetical protein [Gluconacetobacter diazotrophicus PA1 5]|uniref:Uncharacterized protein n=1 Tax=Gluconacetobacter diazotrophicus TaxID=33996 RepID=A0A7W4I5X6_GLUDI|nr:hypothetical protein [Gluconacetobacter diazotrophicus]ACI52309.1 conserved hypothetical protein [Gluconacetobacter diazotrophicus PA1 5]MBB2156860.1 hypothetical protein [Gluconacetobacter diazotrophicus]TWB04796.1 hypothetical protein FBZ86_11918 [Gluconacetobacter diazotrophicus]